ncbi:MAG: oligosaccharide flippase family protein, partial [Gammaproteobacteria bacterium]|nr:oligosaccharide flippase family protein [Gammaproteobacteria bacterium]
MTMPGMGFSLSNRFLRLSREGFWIVTGQIAAIVGALVGVRILTELLEPTAYGELALGMTIATLVNQTILGPISQGASRFYAPAMEQGDIPGYLQVVKRLVTLAAGVTFMLILVAAIGLVVAGKYDWLAITVAAFVFAILGGCNSVLNGIQNAARQRSVVAIHQGMIAWARFLIAAGLIVLLGASSANAMYGYVLATLLVLGSQALFIRRIIPP